MNDWLVRCMDDEGDDLSCGHVLYVCAHVYVYSEKERERLCVWNRGRR